MRKLLMGAASAGAFLILCGTANAQFGGGPAGAGGAMSNPTANLPSNVPVYQSNGDMGMSDAAKKDTKKTKKAAASTANAAGNDASATAGQAGSTVNNTASSANGSVGVNGSASATTPGVSGSADANGSAAAGR